MHHNTNVFLNHLIKYRLIYFFMIVLFLVGIIFGAIIVNSMTFIQKTDLFFYLDQFMNRLLEGPIVDNQDMFKTTFLYHLQYLGLFFILGLSVIGLPIIWILMFVKGVVVGFSVGFFVNQLGWKGFVFAAASIAPQNIFIIPVYLLASSIAMIFSLALLQKIFSRKIQQPTAQPFLQYVVVFLLFVCVAAVAAIVETFISNQAMELVISWMYN
ncbi:stage II sporulation protein M [Paraliobacillus quinghaiensis]|uniref:Stage II sporulation protein M n=1 Tax=Paraliobacillus quinghaiensis TaxID=470815 RepID=A0A917TG85_9BACI|nr:stage II sporulation protein M [Paraliobacillus quinghaiensis]GGM22343.1 stage II sporulation protein M [Paraliobacillus quinghaiensis]